MESILVNNNWFWYRDVVIAESTDDGATWVPGTVLHQGAEAFPAALHHVSPHVETDRVGNWVAVWSARQSEQLSDFDIFVSAAYEPPIEFDWGDAPDPFYPTLSPLGARHQILTGFHLGHAIDAEEDGQPDSLAMGDDLSGDDDEDGVTVDSLLVPGQTGFITVYVTDDHSLHGLLNAWVDLDQNGIWQDPVEHLIVDDVVTQGANRFEITLPPDARPGTTYVRFRLSTDTTCGLSPGGDCFDGEVEDYQLEILEPGTAIIRGQVWDDLNADGMRDANEPGLDGMRVKLVDTTTHQTELVQTTSVEYDGQPGIDPYGEQGLFSFENVALGRYEIQLDESLGRAQSYPHEEMAYTIVVPSSGQLGYWPSEAPVTVPPGPNWLSSYPYPPGDDHFFSAMEVEIDLPDPVTGNFDGVPDDSVTLSGTTWTLRGAPGTSVTTEMVDLDLAATGRNVGRMTIEAGDKVANLMDDGGLHSPGTIMQLSNPYLAECVFNVSMQLEFPELGHVLTSLAPLLLESEIEQFPAYGTSYRLIGGPASFVDGFGDTQARLLDVTYTPRFGPDFGSRLLLDWGDAPAPYPTLASSNGARHVARPEFYLGWSIDDEPDGQPHPHARGDDFTNIDDEDGVRFLSNLAPTQVATVDVVASQSGFLDAWIDFGDDGSWAQPGDQIFASQALTRGSNTFSFVVPASAIVTPQTFARFRLSNGGGLSYTGFAEYGEVEDYEVEIVGPSDAIWMQQVDRSENGLAVRVREHGGAQEQTKHQVADDFLSTTTGPLTDVHFWATWIDGEPDNIDGIFLHIYSDDPAGPGGSDPNNPFSKPDELLWDCYTGPSFFTEVLEEVLPYDAYLWDPFNNNLQPGDQNYLYRYEVSVDSLPLCEPFALSGTPLSPVKYWLGITVDTYIEFPWIESWIGWRTREHQSILGSEAVWGEDLPRVC